MLDASLSVNVVLNLCKHLVHHPSTTDEAIKSRRINIRWLIASVVSGSCIELIAATLFCIAAVVHRKLEEAFVYLIIFIGITLICFHNVLICIDYMLIQSLVFGSISSSPKIKSAQSKNIIHLKNAVYIADEHVHQDKETKLIPAWSQ